MPENLPELSDLDRRDPEALRPVLGALGALMRTYFRAEVQGMENVPDGGVLVVSNHSGGTLAMDIPIFAAEFAKRFGLDRPFYVLAHDFLFLGPAGGIFRRCGLVPASRSNALSLLRSGGATMVFPGGDFDAARPFHQSGRIDFDGRTGYVATAVEASVPIVPVVSIGGQETQLFLSRGERLAKLTQLDRLIRAKYLPVSFGVPFGISVILPINLPLPSKIVTSVLPPIRLESFGPDPDFAQIDDHVRSVMQAELDRLRSARRFPILG